MIDNGKFPLLNRINEPRDLRGLTNTELLSLVSETRRFLVESIAETGGHLASNLGVVELTIALHYVFDLPKDRIIWDVGHQSYVHKILTGRREGFGTLRKRGGLSGFPKGSESEYDAFDTGHASTSISAALGIAAARDLQGLDFNVAAVIGDGSMTGGLAYEALNNAGQSNTRLIVILNDNGMSISKSVGALSRYLSSIRTKSAYLKAKRGVKDVLGKTPVVGKPVSQFLDKSKDWLKRMLVGGGLFQNLGFNYIGPMNGHDLPELIRMLTQVKDMEGPILLHVHTIKGKGYGNAEKAPANYHGVGSFNIATGQSNGGSQPSYSAAFGETLLNLAKNDNRIVAVTAAMPEGTGLLGFSRAYPERFFDVGIAEEHAVTFSAGMAKQGLVPVFAIYSTFLQRGYGQLIHDVCLQNLHVIFAIDRAGVVGPDGETHQGLFDISFLTHIPNMTVMCPKNRKELADMLELAVKLSGPIAIRYPKDKPPIVFESLEHTPVRKGAAELLLAELLLKGSGEYAIAGLGAMTEHAYTACGRLKAEGINVTLYNARFAKPIDTNMIKDLSGYKNVFTIEDNVAAGGFGESVAAKLSGLTKVHIMAFPDEFVTHSTRAELLKAYGMDADGIYKTIRKAIH